MIGICELLVEKKEKLAVVGLGYVGLPLAVAFGNRGIDVVGFDINEKKIECYRNGRDLTNEVGGDVLSSSNVNFVSDEKFLQKSKFIIVSVPTPVNQDHTPDLSPVLNASKIVGRNLVKGSIIVYESTVYPGVTEDDCVPILEKESGLKCGCDFKVGYSPERINPGDKIHRLNNICKIVSGMDEETLEEISRVYNLIIDVGVYPVSSIKTAEAIKVAENSQRDINIAFMNELAMVFDRMGIDSNEVVDGMNTKWNALGFRPGLVGGHCIGVDPYYFTYEAERLGYHSTIISAGRKINDDMGNFVADAAIKQMILSGINIKEAKVAVFGLTFKEDCPDIRNSRVFDLIQRLKEYAIEPVITDPWADKGEIESIYGIFPVKDYKSISSVDCLIIAVAHSEYKAMGRDDICAVLSSVGERVIIDVKGIFSQEMFQGKDVRYWRL